MPENIHRESLDAFWTEFRRVGKEVYHEYALKKKVPLQIVMNSFVEASYKTLCDAVLARMILTGKAPPYQYKGTPADKVRTRECVVAEILAIIGSDIAMADPRHDYSVGIVKREKRRKS